MTLVVSDGLHNNTTTATITITDVNDNVPLFSQNQYRVTNITEDDTSITQTNPKSLIQVYLSQNNPKYDIACVVPVYRPDASS